MKKEFSTKWKASKQPRKQRKYRAKAPLHIKRKFLSSNLSKELRKRHGRRSFPLRKGDLVIIMRGTFKGKQGKVDKIDIKRTKVNIEKMQRSKKDGTKVNVVFNPSNLQIKELNLDDQRRIKAIEKQKKIEIKKEESKTVKGDKK